MNIRVTKAYTDKNTRCFVAMGTVLPNVSAERANELISGGYAEAVKSGMLKGSEVVPDGDDKG